MHLAFSALLSPADTDTANAMPRPRQGLLVAAILMATAVLAAPQATMPAATAPAATAPGIPDGLTPGDMDGDLLTATPTGTPIAKPSAVSSATTSSNSVHLSESALAGIIVGCVIGGLLLGVVSSAIIFVCLSRRHEYYEEDEDDTAATSPEKLQATHSRQAHPPFPTPRSPHAPVVPPRPDGGLGMMALQPTESGTSDPVAPSLPSIHCGSLGTPADWEAERARTHGPGVQHVPTGTPLGYSDSRPMTPTRFWRGLRDRRVSQMTIRSAKTKAKRASIVTVKSMKSGKSRRASILTARSKLSGRSKHSNKAGGGFEAPPVPPLPFTRRVPVPPLSPGLTGMPPNRPTRRVHMRLITPDPPAQLDD